MVDYQKLRNFDLLWTNYGNLPKQLNFFNKFIALELSFTIEKYGTKEKRWYYEKNYGIMDKSMVLWFSIKINIWYNSKLLFTFVIFG